ncbi:MAG: CBS domain-containing protein [Planctomycetes bacterium]|nr:CBS domain-containing protein [Planctomycetota bacterium]
MILAKNVMTKDVTTIGEDTPVKKMIQIIRKTSFSGLPVVDKSGRVVGLISQNDILHALAWAVESEKLTKAFHAGKRRVAVKLLKSKGKVGVGKLLEKPVKELMTAGVVHCGPDAPVAELCEIMVSKRIHRIVVLDADRKVLGLISATDLVRKFGEQLRGARALTDE